MLQQLSYSPTRYLAIISPDSKPALDPWPQVNAPMAIALSQVSMLWVRAVLWQTPGLNGFPRELQAVCSAHLEAASTV